MKTSSTVETIVLVIVCATTAAIAAMMAFPNYDSRKATVLSTKECIDIEITSGTKVVAVRILKQMDGEFDKDWRLSADQSLEHDTILRDVLFQKQQDDGREDPLTKGDLEYRIAKIK